MLGIKADNSSPLAARNSCITLTFMFMVHLWVLYPARRGEMQLTNIYSSTHPFAIVLPLQPMPKSALRVVLPEYREEVFRNILQPCVPDHRHPRGEF